MWAITFTDPVVESSLPHQELDEGQDVLVVLDRGDHGGGGLGDHAVLVLILTPLLLLLDLGQRLLFPFFWFLRLFILKFVIWKNMIKYVCIYG